MPFIITVAGPARTINGNQPTKSLQGHTLDISPHGLSLVVPAIRIGDYHLMAESRGFSLLLELPPGPVELRVAPVRYEALEDHQTEKGFLIGVRIVESPGGDHKKYSEYVASLSALKP